jgi:hypothetical protein
VVIQSSPAKRASRSTGESAAGQSSPALAKFRNGDCKRQLASHRGCRWLTDPLAYHPRFFCCAAAKKFLEGSTIRNSVADLHAGVKVVASRHTERGQDGSTRFGLGKPARKLNPPTRRAEAGSDQGS